MNVDEVWASALELAMRRMELARKMPTCPVCRSPQVQLTVYASKPAKWRCRMCRVRFDMEPPN